MPPTQSVPPNLSDTWHSHLVDAVVLNAASVESATRTAFTSSHERRRAVPQSELNWRGVGINFSASPARISTCSSLIAPAWPVSVIALLGRDDAVSLQWRPSNTALFTPRPLCPSTIVLQASAAGKYLDTLADECKVPQP